MFDIIDLGDDILTRYDDLVRDDLDDFGGEESEPIGLDGLTVLGDDKLTALGDDELIDLGDDVLDDDFVIDFDSFGREESEPVGLDGLIDLGDDVLMDDEDWGIFGKEESELFKLGDNFGNEESELFGLGEDAALELFDATVFWIGTGGVVDENKLDQEDDLDFCGMSVKNLQQK